jgi:NifB/MoaA-like Fe-S oxidoreductase
MICLCGNKTPLLSFKRVKNISLVTSEAAAPFLHLFLQDLQKITGLTSNLYPLTNHFWGGNVDVAGLLTGSDLIRGLDGKNLGEILFIPAVMLKEESELFLDGYSLAEVSAALKVKIIPVDSPVEPNAAGDYTEII